MRPKLTGSMRIRHARESHLPARVVVYSSAMRALVPALAIAVLASPAVAVAEPAPSPRAKSQGTEVHWTVEIPEGYRVETRTYPELAIAGGCIFGAAWIAGVAMAAATVDEADRGRAAGHTLIPVAGPLFALGQDYDTSRVAPYLVIASGVQGLGLVGLAVGLTIDSRVLVPAPRPSKAHPRAALRLAPGGVQATFSF